MRDTRVLQNWSQRSDTLREAYRLIQGREADARAAFTRSTELVTESIRVNPNDWQEHGSLALYRAYLGDSDGAQIALNKMFELNPANNPMSHYWAGLVAYEAGDIDRTFVELEQALLRGFSGQKRFITDEPALKALRTEHAARFAALIQRY